MTAGQKYAARRENKKLSQIEERQQRKRPIQHVNLGDDDDDDATAVKLGEVRPFIIFMYELGVLIVLLLCSNTNLMAESLFVWKEKRNCAM